MKARHHIQRPWPLWLKICAALLCAMFAVTLLAVQLDAKYRQHHLDEELKQQSYLILRLISAGAQEAVIIEDIPLLNTLVQEAVVLDPNLTSLEISNEADQPIAWWRRADYEGIASTSFFEQPIDYEGELFGGVKAQWDIAALAEKIDKQLARENKILMFSLLCLTSLSLVMLHVLVASPIRQLASQLRALSDGGAAEKLKINSSREMSMLADAVNELNTAMHHSRSLTEELSHQATHDSLTGLKNRHAFELALTERLDDRLSDSAGDVLLYFDLDQFKIINDTCGHAAGDELLVELAATLMEVFKPEDIFARLGGDEFAALLYSTSLEEGQVIAERVRAETQAFRFNYQGRSFVIGASVGLVCISETDEKPKRIMTAADEACYAAKDAGRNRVHVYEENDDELNQRRGEMNWVPKIHAALEASSLILYGQLIAPTTDDNGPLHVEVLVRMLDEDGSIVPPGAFLPAAERFGIMPDMDRWVIDNTLRWMEEQLNLGREVPLCSINVSGISLSDAKFRRYILDVLAETRVPTGNICFEVTETAAVSRLSTAIEFMTMVKNAGCQFALDDFGSGMSSFTYLKNLPVDYVKIDGAFVSPLVSDETCVVMVRAIADIAHVMGLKTIAEFVENDEIHSKLVELGIDYVQGYGVGKPQALTDFEPAILVRAA